MKKLKQPMWQNGEKQLLTHILDKFPTNDLKWSLVIFHGIGKAPVDCPMPDFEDILLTFREGFVMSWSEVYSFASDIQDIDECVLVACKKNVMIDASLIRQEDYSECEVVVEAIDSTWWVIQSKLPFSSRGF